MISDDSDIREQINNGVLIAASDKRAPTLDEQIDEFKKREIKPPELPQSISKNTSQAGDGSALGVSATPTTPTRASLLNKLLQRKQTVESL